MSDAFICAQCQADAKQLLEIQDRIWPGAGEVETVERTTRALGAFLILRRGTAAEASTAVAAASA